jgi:hypothetical protein
MRSGDGGGLGDEHGLAAPRKPTFMSLDGQIVIQNAQPLDLGSLINMTLTYIYRSSNVIAEHHNTYQWHYQCMPANSVD